MQQATSDIYGNANVNPPKIAAFDAAPIWRQIRNQN